jgi:hypothetical protein
VARVREVAATIGSHPVRGEPMRQLLRALAAAGAFTALASPRNPLPR